MKNVVLALFIAFVAVGCGKTPPSLSPTGAKYYQADRGVVALGGIQTAAINLNKVGVCEPAPCHPLLSDANTRIVIDTVAVSVKTIQAAPEGWKATVQTALTNLGSKLDELGKKELLPYFEAAQAVLRIF